jgi:hypothetical protein
MLAFPQIRRPPLVLLPPRPDGEVYYRPIYTYDELRHIVPSEELSALDPTAIDFGNSFAECVVVDPDAPIEPGAIYNVVRSTGHRAYTRALLPYDKIKAKVIGHSYRAARIAAWFLKLLLKFENFSILSGGLSGTRHQLLARPRLRPTSHL